MTKRGGEGVGDGRTGCTEWDRFCVWCAGHEFEDGLADGYDGGVAALDVLDYVSFVYRAVCER